jgi:hypothetical protein
MSHECLYCSFQGVKTTATRVLVQAHPAADSRTPPPAKDIEIWDATHGRVYLCDTHAAGVKTPPGKLVDADS